MSTTKARYMINDTRDVARALDVAERVWPNVPRGATAVRRLIAKGADSLRQEQEVRRAAVDALLEFGDAGPAYPPDYLQDLRDEWPA